VINELLFQMIFSHIYIFVPDNSENWIQVSFADPNDPDYISAKELTHNGKYRYLALAKENPTESDIEDFLRDRDPVMRINWNEFETSCIQVFGLGDKDLQMLRLRN
jgi:hypothetical protein